jgi:hypothetical protein
MVREKEEHRIKKVQNQKERQRILKRKKGRNLKRMMSHMEMTMKKLEKVMMDIKETIWLTSQWRLMMD